jgi:ribonuclease III
VTDPLVASPAKPRRRRTRQAEPAGQATGAEAAVPAVAPAAPAVPAAAPFPQATGEPEDDRRVEVLADRIGIAFRDPELLRLALTHRSIIQDVVAAGGDPAEAAIRTNERLEFLGDAVLGAIAAGWLYHRAPGASEGALTRQRVALVRAETLVRWARELGLGDLLYLGHGERPSEGARDRMLAGAFEALVGAVALDQGYGAASAFLDRFLERDAASILGTDEAEVNPKGRLQELLQERFRTGPSYRTLAVDGPAHQQVFTVQALLRDRVLGEGTGASKREAQQAAAAAALATVEGMDVADSPAGAAEDEAPAGAPR